MAEQTILKDTRQYDRHTISFGGDNGCVMPPHFVDENRSACHVEKNYYVKEGELLTRQDGRCHQTIWHQLERKPLSYQGVDVSAPSMQVSEKNYPCNADGTLH